MPLVGFRILFGLLMLISTIRFMLKGWVAELYLDPVFHFTYYGFWWVKPVSGPWLYAVFIIIALCCLFVITSAFMMQIRGLTRVAWGPLDRHLIVTKPLWLR